MTEPFAYRVDDVFVLTGRGVVVTGTVIRGVIAAGDRVRNTRTGRRLQCTGIEFVCRRWGPPRDPAAVPLVFGGADREHFRPGDLLTGPDDTD
ncbi:hypothetical protein [Nocardia stercoris]|uniref:Elongation factor Tu n=1 Tax=Nocardia stercoris TaxID=2483361 RepID=A0A3M2L5E6_9NOCA|nr:hypothetical protein [Nocardia stercoris]RMI32857.1 hypothetical protein EBN03_13120 [Nocardia stercoris]